MRARYTTEQIEWLRQTFKRLRLPELTDAFNAQYGLAKTPAQIRSTLKNYKIKSYRPRGQAKGERSMISAEQRAWITREYKTHPVADLTPLFNERFGTDYTAGQLKAWITRNKIHSGRTGCFPRGKQPWNKGTKGVMKPNSGNFKPGHSPRNRKPLWSERIDPKDGYILIKVPERDPCTGCPTRYKLKHVWLWEQDRGPVPEGHNICFIDGDKTNCTLDNLECVSKAENAVRNKMRYAAYPDDVKPTLQLVAKLKLKRGERRRQQQDNTQ